jgi:hypothetical protein
VEVPALKNPLFATFVCVLVLASNAFAQSVRLLDDPATSLADRFGKVPPPGVHPRILIGPQELVRLRQLVQNTQVGKYVLSRTESFLGGLRNPQKDLKVVYDHLVSGDRNALTYTKDEWLRGVVPYALALECYDAMLLQDQQRGKMAGAALATLASIPRNWLGNADLFYLALGYDFDYAYLTEDQRSIVRQTIASTTQGKKPYGAGFPPDWENYNWIPAGSTLLLAALAIEGEKGYDTSIYPAGRQAMKDFLHFGITATGGGLEEMHYFHYGMQFGALAMVAFARHGDNLFAEPHYRALPNWLIASMEPFGDAFSTHQDTPNDHGGPSSNYTIMKWVWPDDPVVDMIWRNYIQADYQNLNEYGFWLAVLLFPIDPKESVPYTGHVPQNKNGVMEPELPPNYPDPVRGIGSLNLPLDYWDPERGLLITRDRWQSDGMVLDFDINVQAKDLGGHYHSNSTMFTLSALRRKWAIDRGFHIAETKDNSLILIDGRGQGFFPVGGDAAEYRTTAHLAVIAGDSSNPYHWMAASHGHTGAPYLAGFHWEPDPHPEVIKKFSEIATVNKQEPWNDANASYQFTYRASYNPVEKAFRTAALRRNAPHSYVLIIDDIKKDANSHQYDWLMQVPDDLVVKGNRDGGVILGSADPKDNRRLLVQMIRANGTGDWVLENYEVKRSPETGDTSSFGMGHRIRYSVRVVEPGFQVLLLPFRDGDALPAISKGARLEVRWPNQTDTYDLTTLPTGRTEIHLHE